MFVYAADGTNTKIKVIVAADLYADSVEDACEVKRTEDLSTMLERN